MFRASGLGILWLLTLAKGLQGLEVGVDTAMKGLGWAGLWVP